MSSPTSRPSNSGTANVKVTTGVTRLPVLSKVYVPERLRQFLNAPEVGLLLAIIFAVALFSLVSPNFFDLSTAQLILRAVAAIGIIAVAEAILLMTREFDLSVGAVAGLGALTAGTLMKDMPWVQAVLVGVLVGAVFGLINGLLVTKLRIPCLIATLGMMFVAQGLTQVVTRGFPVSGLPDDFRAFGRSELLGLPTGVWVFFLVVVVADVVLRRTVFGRAIYATGGNVNAARLTGLQPDRVKIIAFVNAGILSVVAGVLAVGRVGTGDPSTGAGWELAAIAGAIVGGVSLFGGAGRAVGALLGMLFLQVIATGMTVIGLDTSLKGVAVGFFLVAAIAADRWKKLRAH